MKSLSTRRIASACVVSAATVAALVLPGAASATVGQQCSGVSIIGQGSSLQAVAQQELWGPAFHTSSGSLACNGTQGSKGTPTITYSGGNVSNTWSYTTGSAGDIVIVRVMYLWPIATGPLGFNLGNQGSSNKRLLVATSVAKSEPYTS